MRFAIHPFLCRKSHFTLAAACLAAWLAAGQAAHAAYGIVVDQLGDTLYVTGNENANTLSIVGAESEDGTVAVYVVDVPWVYEGVNHIHVDLGNGDNFLGLDRINISGNLVVLTGEGRDEVDLGGWNYGPSSFGGNVEIATAGGRDMVQIEDASVVGSVTIDTAEGSDIVEIGDDGILFSIVGDRAPRRTVASDSVQANVAERDDAPGDLAAPADDPDEAKFIVGLVYSAALPSATGSLYVYTGAGRDQVGITGTQVNVETIIELGTDDDRLRLEHPNQFYGDFTARGQQGSDHLYDDPGNFYETAPHFLQFELP
jgi:hypothetical protein